jgi:hypothetical protein
MNQLVKGGIMQRVKRELNTPSPFKLGMSYCTALAVVIFFIFQHYIASIENKLVTFESTVKNEVREQIKTHSHNDTVDKAEFNSMRERMDDIYLLLVQMKE